MNQKPSVGLDAQLDKRSSELDEREAAIAEREQEAERLDALVVKRQHELAMLDKTIIDREALLNDQKSQMALLDSDYARKSKVYEAASTSEQDKYLKWQQKTEALKPELQSIKDSIAERQDYAKQQERLIAKQSEEGNVQLKGLEYEIIEAKQVIKDLEQKRKNLYQEAKVLEQDLESARDSFAPEVADHEAAIVVIEQRKQTMEGDIIIVETRIHDLNKEVSTLLIKRQQIHDDVDAKLQFLDGKEREIMAKREALRVEQEEMEEKRHHYSRDSLYNEL